MNAKELQMIGELIDNPQRIEACMESNEVMYLCLDCSIKDPKIYVYICQNCLESKTHKKHKIIQTDNGDLSERCSCGDSEMLGVVIECDNHNKNTHALRQKVDKKVSPQTQSAFEHFAMVNFTRIFKTLESNIGNSSTNSSEIVDTFYEQFMDISIKQPQICATILMKTLNNFYTRHNCQSPTIDIDASRYQRLCSCSIIENLFRQSEKTSWNLKRILLNCVRYRPFVFQLTKIYSKMLLPLFETENNQLLDLMKEFNPPQVFQVFISQVALVKNIMNLLENILQNLETSNYESYLKKFETLNNLMKFIFKREMQVDESMMKQFCNIISKVCVSRKEIKDYFHEEILIVMEEMNFDFLRLLLNSLHRQSDWKQISANLIYEYIVKCECEVDYEFSEERKKNPWFQGSVGILGILLCSTFVEIYEETVAEEINQSGNKKINNTSFITKTNDGRIIGNIEKAKEAMRKYTLGISRHTQNGLEKLFKSICREIMRDLFFIFTQERALRNNQRAQYNEESNEYQMKTVLHCYKNRLYYRELSNLQMLGMLISPEMFMQAAFEAMKWKPQRFDRTFYKYQKQYYPQQFEQSPAFNQSQQKASSGLSQATSHNSQSHKLQNSNTNNNQQNIHKRAVSYQQARNFSSFSCSSSNSNEKDTIQRNNRRVTNISEAGILKEQFHKEGIEDSSYDYYDDGIDEDDEDLFDLEEKKGTLDESILLKYEFVSEILILCNIDVLNLINNIQPCFKEDKIFLNEIRRNICINTFNFQSQISMVNLTTKLENMKLFETSSLKKIIFNFSELGNNKLLKLKTQFCEKYEPVMWRPYSWLDAEFIEKLKEKKLECILGNMSPLLEKHVFFSDLPSSPTFLKFIRNSFHFLYKNSSILSNILKITYDLLMLNHVKTQEQNQLEKEVLKQKSDKQQKAIKNENQFLQNSDSENFKQQIIDFRLTKERFYQFRLDHKQIQAIKQFYSQSIQPNVQQINENSPARAAGVSDNEGLLQSFNIFFDQINKQDLIYSSPRNSSNNIELTSNQVELKQIQQNNTSTHGSSIDSSNNLTQITEQQRKQLLQAKQKEILQQFQNKQKKFQDQNEQILDKSFNTVVTSNNNNNSGNKSLSIYSQQNNLIQYSPYQESLLEQQECVICKTDIGITVIHAYVIQDNLSCYFKITENNLIPSSLTSKFAVTGCQHITHQKCHEMGIENIQISKRALSKDDKEAQLETFCTICKSLSNISVVVLDCYFKKVTFGSMYQQLFSQQQNPATKRYLHQSSNSVSSFNINTNQQTSPKSQQTHQKGQSYQSQNSSNSIQKPNQNNQIQQASKTDFKDSTKKILDNLVHQEIIQQDKQIINHIYSALEEFLSLLAIISNNEDIIQEFHIYSVGDSLLQSILEKVLLTQNMENYFEKDFKLLENLFLNLKVIFKGQESEQKRLKQEYLNLTIQKILETNIFDYALNQLLININKPQESISFCMMYISIIFRIALIYGEEQSVQYSRDFLQNIYLIFTIKELINSQKSSCNFSLYKQNKQQFYSESQEKILFEDIKSIWLNEDNQESRENVQISCIPYIRMVSIFLQLVCNIDSQNNNSNMPFQYPKNNLDPIDELQKYEKTFGKYFTNLDLEFTEYTLKESNDYFSLIFIYKLQEYYENHSRQLNNFFEFEKKIFKLSQIDQNFETFYKHQFWKKCQIDFNFPQIEKSPLIMCLICGLQMADNCQRGLRVEQNDINHALQAHKGYCVYIQLQDGLLIYVEKDSVQTSQSLFYDKLGRMANCLNYPEWDEFQLDKAKFQEVEELVINRKLANYVRYILMQTEDDYAYFDEDYTL